MNNSSISVVLVGKRNKALRAARQLGLKAIVVDPADSDPYELQDSPIRAVAAVTEGAVLPAAAIRATLGLPGLSLEASRRCTDKLAMKQAILAAGIPCTPFVPLGPGPVDAKGLLTELGAPLILKHQQGFGGRGTIKASRPEELPASVDVPSLAEAYIHGTEMSVESLIVDGRPIFVNFTQYVEPGWSSFVPAELDDETTAELVDLNARSIAALGVERGMTHMEVFLTGDGCVFSELAARPPGGQIMSLISNAYGFDPWQALLAIEIGEPERITVTNRAAQYAAMRFIHPGPGIVERVHGLDQVRALPSLQEFKCLLEAGDEVAAREGTGQHRGFVIFCGEADQVRGDLENFRRTLKVEMR